MFESEHDLSDTENAQAGVSKKAQNTVLQTSWLNLMDWFADGSPLMAKLASLYASAQLVVFGHGSTFLLNFHVSHLALV